MYALSNAAPFSVFRLARFDSPPDLRLLLVALSPGATLSLVTRSTADLFTPVWSVIIRSANFLTSALADVDCASLPASISTWLAVTTIDAICASLTPCADAPATANNSVLAMTMAETLMCDSSVMNRRLVPLGRLVPLAKNGRAANAHPAVSGGAPSYTRSPTHRMSIG